MITVNLKYPNGATYTAETATVTDLIAVLQTIAQDVPLFLLDKSKQGKIPVRILGLTEDPDISTGFAFMIEPVVDLD